VNDDIPVSREDACEQFNYWLLGVLRGGAGCVEGDVGERVERQGIEIVYERL
jgi:hypothetical protein